MNEKFFQSSYIQSNPILDIPIYVINRYDHHHRWKNVFHQLQNKIHFKSIYRVDAVLPDEAEEYKLHFFSSKVYKNIIYGPTDLNIIPTWSAAACAMSHLKAWQMALEQNHDIIIIAEDDIKIKNVDLFCFHLLETYLKCREVKDTIYFFGGNVKLLNSIHYYLYTPFGNSFRLSNNNAILFSHFYMTNKTVLLKLLQNYYPIEYQIDIHISNILKDRCKLSVINIPADSSIIQNKSIFHSSVQFYKINNANVLFLIFNHQLPYIVCYTIWQFSNYNLSSLDDYYHYYK
jgi:hypothetical protein